MGSIHLICRGGLHLHPTAFPVFDSGFWDLSEADAERLVGGMLYLHETKASPSYFGGVVRGFRVAGSDELAPGRIVFSVESTREGKGVAWKGAAHSMAWTGGLVD